MRTLRVIAFTLLLFATACGGCAVSLHVPRGYKCPLFSDAHQRSDVPEQAAEARGQAT